MNITLYKAAIDVQDAINTCIDQETGEIDKDKLDNINATFKDRCIATAAVIKQLRYTIKMLDEHEQEVKKQREKATKIQERLKENLLNSMKAAGAESVSSDDSLIKIRLLKDRDSIVEIDDGAVFSENLCLPPRPPQPSKALIRAAIERGEEVVGARVLYKDRLEIL